MDIPHTTHVLDNGLTLFVHEDHSLPLVSSNLWYHVGSGDEAPGRTGFAHLFEHLMFMGSEHVPTGTFDALLESAGCDNNGSTTVDRTNYYEDGPAHALELMLWLESDRMGWLLPQIDQAKLDLQRGVVQNERRQSYENQPYGLAHETLARLLYPAGHPYSWPTIGSMADLDAASLATVHEFCRTYYGPSNATLAIAGDVEAARVRAQVERWFGPIPKGRPVPRPQVAPFRLEAPVRHTLEDRVQLPRLYLAWHSVRGFAPGDAALEITAELLAGGKSSRLYQRLVYQLEIASQVVAYQDGGRLDGKFLVYATARPGHALGELRDVIDEELQRLANSGPTEHELERVRNGIEAQFVDMLERVGGFSGRANQLNYYAWMAGDAGSFERDWERYRAVTVDDVRHAARATLLDAARVELSVVPAGAPQLAAGGENGR